MTKEDIIRMAREAGAVFPADGSYHSFEFEGSLERFADLIAAAERERIKQANAPEIEKINAHIKAQEDELKALREFAAGRCTIQKVIDELGPMSLWSYAAMEKKMDEARAEEREECAKVADRFAVDREDEYICERLAEALRKRK